MHSIKEDHFYSVSQTFRQHHTVMPIAHSLFVLLSSIHYNFIAILISCDLVRHPHAITHMSHSEFRSHIFSFDCVAHDHHSRQYEGASHSTCSKRNNNFSFPHWQTGRVPHNLHLSMLSVCDTIMCNIQYQVEYSNTNKESRIPFLGK